MLLRKKKQGPKIISDEILPNRRSSLKVNLSYRTSLSDSGNESFSSVRNDEETTIKNKTRLNSKDVKSQNVENKNSTDKYEHPALSAISQKEIALDESCQQLREVIIQRTKEFYNNEEELMLKTTSVLKGQRQALKDVNHDRNNSENIGVRKSNTVIPRIDSEGSPKKRISDDDSSRTLSLSRKTRKANQSVILGGNKCQEVLPKQNNKVLKVRLTRVEDSRSNFRELSIESNISNIGAPAMCSSFITEEKIDVPPSQPAETERTSRMDNVNNTEKSAHQTEDISTLTPMEITAIRTKVLSIGKSRIHQNKTSELRENYSEGNKSFNEVVPMELTSVHSHLPFRSTSNINETSRTSLSVNESIKSSKSIPSGQKDGANVSLTVNTSIDSLDSSNSSNENSSKNTACRTSILGKIGKKTIICDSDSDSVEEMPLVTRLQNSSENKFGTQRKSFGIETSFIEGTPYPPSRSILWKTQIRCNKTKIKGTGLQESLQKLLDETSSTNSRSESTSKSSQYLSLRSRTSIVESPNKSNLNTENPSVISDSSREEKSLRVTKESVIVASENTQDESPQKTGKKKLLSKADEADVVSFTPLSLENSQQKPITWKPRKFYRKKTLRAAREKKIEASIEKDSSDENDPVCSSTRPIKKSIVQAPIKRTRKVISKKIVIEKSTNRDWLERLKRANSGHSSQGSDRNSINEFLNKKKLSMSGRNSKPQKLILVTTGFAKGDIDLVKSVVKELGNAEVNSTVTRRTTHVISTGVRTINLLRGIIRGCWLLSLDWVLKSLENGKWLNPAKFEMVHFSKAVQENRRDRELFGKSYVPELFVTCGLIHIEKGASPPVEILKELVKTAGGRIAENERDAALSVGPNGIKEIWILDSITTGDLQPLHEYQRN